MDKVMVLALAGTLWGQTFEVASIKPAAPGTAAGRQPVSTPGRFAARDTVKRLFAGAYEVQYAQIYGGPAWLGTDVYEIDARSAGPATRELQSAMLRSLLGDRFLLKFHRETRELTVYALTAKPGVKLHEAREAEAGVRDTGLNRARFTASMPKLASYLSQLLTVPIWDPTTRTLRPRETAPLMVVDQTGLKGTYDIPLQLTPDADGDEVTVFQRAIAPLGLRLERRKAPVEILTIDHAERPREN